MGEESGGDNKVKETIDAVTGLVKAVPVYDDLVQPAAKELGKSLETLAKAINVALYPVSGLVWGFEQIKGFLDTKLASKLKDVPPEDIIPPKPNVAGPAIEALRYTGHEESLSDMYANLLASAMNKNTAEGAHPAFVEVIKQLTPDEAKLMALFLKDEPFQVLSVRAELKTGNGGITIAHNLSLFGERASLEVKALIPSYLDNLNRLGLIYIHNRDSYTDPGMYDELEASELVQHHKSLADARLDRTSSFVRGYVRLTDLGEQFGKVCVLRRENSVGEVGAVGETRQ